MSELCLRGLILAIDVSLKALLLAAVTASVIRLLRVRHSNLKHAAWLGVLAGMIGLPWMSSVLPAIPLPLPLRPETILSTRETTPRFGAEPAAAPVDSVTSESPTVELDAIARRDFRFPNEMAGNLAAPGWKESRRDSRTVSPIDSDETDLTTAEESAAPLEPSSATRFLFSKWPVIAITIWGVGVLALWARLLLAIHVTRQMVRRSTPIRAETHPRLNGLAEASQSLWQAGSAWRNVCLRESADIFVPLTTGLLHPQILLPLDWKTWPAEKLGDVLMHELTHIRRCDCWTALAAEVAATHYWFHPLAWWLRRRLAVLAEDCCDDAAIGSTDNRAAYARHLLEIAGVLCHQRRRFHYVGLSMARRPNVERRILSILDTNRPLSRRLTWSATLLLVTMILPLVAVAAALKPAGQSSTEKVSQAKPEAARPSPNKPGASPKIQSALTQDTAEPREPNSNDPTQTARRNSEEIEFHGKVVGADGQPLAGADIWFAASPYEAMDKAAQRTLRRVAVSDSRGDFAFRSKPIENAEQSPIEWTQIATLVAKAPGHGCDWLPLTVFEQDPVSSEARVKLQQQIDESLGSGRFASRTLKLPPEAGPVRGRLVDLEGRPLKGVAVLVEQIQNPDMALLREGFEKASRDVVDQSLWARTAPQGSLNRRNWQALIAPVKTNGNGEFALSGLGRDQIATVTLLGERVEAERFFIVGTEMETKRLPHISPYPNGAKDAFVGVNFALAVGPAIPVSGVVSEFKTGKPIANATVFVERLFSQESLNSLVQLRLWTTHIRAVTDEQGRYQLLGIPPGEGHVLNVIPPASEPWLIASQKISLDPGQATAAVNVQVFRGIWIEGRVTDADTGESIKGSVDYLALKKNPNIPQEFGLDDGWKMERFPIAAGGRYRTAGLPGPGLLLVRSFGKKIYPRSVGAEKIEGYDPKSNSIPTTPTGLPLSNWHLVQFIDPSVDAASYDCDLTLSAGVSLVGRIVGPDGSPVSHIEAFGLVEKNAFFEPLTDDKFTVNNYQPEGSRNLFFKSADQSLVGYLHLEGKPPADLTIRLKPSVTARGKLVETEADEPAAGYQIFCESSKQGNFRLNDTTTDKNGWFEIKGLMAGNVYRMDSVNVELVSNGKNRFTVDLTNAKPGDLVEFGDVTGKNAKPKK